MREIRLSGSVRGVRRKPYPYRDHPIAGAEGTVAALALPMTPDGATEASKPPRRTACGSKTASTNFRWKHCPHHLHCFDVPLLHAGLPLQLQHRLRLQE